MAKAMIEMAVWDLFARASERPLCDVVGGAGDAIATGVSLGLQPSVDDMLSLVAEHVDLGYRRVKLKIKPGWDIEPHRAARAAFPGLVTTADANSAYTLDDIDQLRGLDGVNLDYLEQPLRWDDIADHAELARSMATPL